MGRKKNRHRRGTSAQPTISVSALPAGPALQGYQTGDKFADGFGATYLLQADYWTLRARSAQLFETNLYARGLIRRLVTNEINTGLHLEATPEEALLGFEEDELAGWAEDVENRFTLWESNPRLCDVREQSTFGAIQGAARMEALITGDVLVVLHQDERTKLPRVQLVNGSLVTTPIDWSDTATTRCVHGVELDAFDRHVAFWVSQKDGTSRRIPAYGEKSGRRQAWLLYGTDKRHDDVRGKPLLSLVLQSLREIDRYRDSTQRKAVINSMIAMYIKKGEEKIGSAPITGGAIRRGTSIAVDQTGKQRSFAAAELIPGVVMQELQAGEEPIAFPSHGTDEKFGEFEEAIVQAVAWANEIPPEILMLAFSSNYSASQAAINELKMYLNKARASFGSAFCQPVYTEWLLSVTMTSRIQAAGFLQAQRDPTMYDIFGAWTSADWTGHIKPAVDLSKLVKGYEQMVANGFITRDRASRELTGTKYSKNVQKLRRENELLAEANEPLAELTAPPAAEPPPAKGDQMADPAETDAEEATDDLPDR